MLRKVRIRNQQVFSCSKGEKQRTNQHIMWQELRRLQPEKTIRITVVKGNRRWSLRAHLLLNSEKVTLLA